MTVLPAPSVDAFVDPVGTSVFVSAARWIEAVLMGPVATSIAVMAVASVGLLMLSGRVNIRRGASVILGCFILFGAATIAQGLRGAASAVTRGGSSQPVNVIAPTPQVVLEPPSEEPVEVMDPYAGASFRR